MITDTDIRCPTCHKLLSIKATRPWKFMCPRCRTMVEYEIDYKLKVEHVPNQSRNIYTTISSTVKKSIDKK